MTADGSACRPKVLVLMATFNGVPWIAEQIRSIAAQQGVDTTLVLCDDRSSDGTVALARSVAGDTLRIEVNAPDEPGGSASANFFRLMRHASLDHHEYVALADQDDVWAPDKLLSAVRRLRTEGAAGSSSAVEAFWPDGRSAVLAQCPTTRLADYLFEGAGQGCSFVVTAEFFARFQQLLLHEAARFEPLHYHDWALYAVCRALGGRWSFDPVPRLQYRQHTGNDTGARRGLQALRKRIDLIRSGWYAAQIDAVARVCVAVGDPAHTIGAARYLALAPEARHWRGRLALAAFVLRHGRRSGAQRLILVWAALSGYAGPAITVTRPHSGRT